MFNIAKANIKGGLLYPEIKGEVIFLQYPKFVEVSVMIHNLPKFERSEGLKIAPFGFHIHNGKNCEVGQINDQFPLVGSHYNPNDQPHGNHAGDFPVLMPLSNGTVMMKFTTDKFKLNEVLGYPVVIHLSPDDYSTEPAGNSGIKIACGTIENNFVQY